jgi:SAM-dependent methyltransferase
MEQSVGGAGHVGVDPANQEAHEAWNGPLFERFVEYRDAVVTGLGAHGDRALALNPPRPGNRVLDVGCGFGDSTRQIARLVGAEGEAVGVDVAERFIEVARQEAEEAGVPNASFVTADVQATQPDGPFDYAFSRFGTMFFASPGAAMRRVRQALVPGGRLCMVVWRRKLDNEWLHRAELAINDLLERPEETDEPTCGPGPFSMADADTTSEILIGAGFEGIELRREDLIFELGPDLEKARELVMALGPAGELIRLAGDQADQIRGKLENAVEGALAECVQPDGSVCASSSTWIVTATAP